MQVQTLRAVEGRAVIQFGLYLFTLEVFEWDKLSVPRQISVLAKPLLASLPE